MIGVFTTRKFESRQAFIAGRPFEVLESTNQFTLVGLEWMWKMMSGQLRNGDGGLTDHLGSARLVVGNSSQEYSPSDERLAGDQTAQAELDNGFPQVHGPVVDDEEPVGYSLALRATFGEDEGVFDWAERGVVTAQGLLLDRAVRDQGRKPLGAVWQLDAVLTLTR